MEKKKFIKDALVWNAYAGRSGAWLRVGNLNLVTEENPDTKEVDEYYVSPFICGTCKMIYRSVYEYEPWMEEYIGTSKDIRPELFEEAKAAYIDYQNRIKKLEEKYPELKNIKEG